MVRHAVLALSILLAALVAAQDAQAGGPGRGLVPMPPVIRPVNPHPGNRPPFHHNGFKNRNYMPYWGYGVYAPPVTYVTPVTYVNYVPYEPAPVYEPAPPAYSQPSMDLGLPPMPSVIPFPEGRYVLMGDGLTSAYRWVWIPNPPSAPPAPSAPGPAGPAVSRGGQLYRWVDDQDVVHFTQGWDAVPERYRAQVKLAP